MQSLLPKKNQYILDPTNMVSFYRGDKNRLYIEGASNNKYVKINYISRNIIVLCGNISLECFHVQKSKNENHSIEIYQEDFIKTYDKACSKITEDLGILEQFYCRNEELYEELHEVSAKKYIKFPFL